MKGILGLVTGCSLVMAALALALTGSPVRAQTPPEVTITLKLTINGTPPSQFSFGVEHEVELCAAPCVGAGHTYTKTLSWLKGSNPVQFVFDRFVFVGNGTPLPDQEFGQQTVIPTSNRTVSASYTFRSASTTIATPSTGSTGPFAVGAGPAGTVVTEASDVQTQPRLVTFTFKLTINGTPLKGDGFAVQWGETGLELCNAPCAGSGHTYVQTMNFPAGATETFVFIRGSGRVTPDHPGQMFGKQTLTAKNDRTLSAFFTYGTAAIATPSTGSVPPLAYGGTIAGAGAALMLLSLWRRRGMRTAA